MADTDGGAAGAAATGNDARVPDGADKTPEFLVCGHVVQDLLSDGEPEAWRLGGAVAYASRLARKFGLRTAALTSAGPDMDFSELLPGIAVATRRSEETTQIRNMYTDGRRSQEMPQRASDIGANDLPEAWRAAPVVLLGPVAGEVDESLASSFSGRLVGAGAQGWLREVGPHAQVRPVPPERWEASAVLERVGALFVSDEDVPAQSAEAALQRWTGMVQTVAFTRGYNGADVCHLGEWRHIDAFPAQATDPTGAGDVFATAFLIRLSETREVWEATRFASCAASFVVEGEGVSAVPDRASVEARLRENPDIVATPK